MTDESLFAAALELYTPEDRVAFLAAACPDPEQRARVEALLTIVARAGTFVRRRPAGSGPLPPPDTRKSSPAQSPPVKVRPMRHGPPRPPVRRVKLVAACLGVLLLLALLVWGTFAATQPSTDTTAPTRSAPTPPAQVRIATPPGTDPDGSDEVTLAGGRTFPVWVKKTVNGEVMRFRCIPPTYGPAFYLSGTKVTNRAFGTPDRPGGASAPAMNMTAVQAMAFISQHFEAANGRLPTPEEWDHAAGLHVQPPGQAAVTLPNGPPVVHKKDPVPPTPGSIGDVNCFGLVDMAGNGREWTCGVISKLDTPPEVATRPTGPFIPDDLVVLRGRNYTLKEGLTFAQLGQEASGVLLQRQLAGEASPYTGFRVLLPIAER